jgi:predicted nucleotidyltransferase
MDDIIVEFSPAAFKHGITEADIRNALSNFLYDDIIIEFENKRLLLGFDTNSNLLEIMYNEIDEQTVNVFHAMRCRSIYYPLIGT